MSNEWVKLKSDGAFYIIDKGKHKLIVGDEILVETEHGMEIAVVVPRIDEANGFRGEQAAEKEGSALGGQSKLTFIRKLNETDRKKSEELSAEAKTYLMECQKKIDKFDLPMQLLDADLSFDEKKLTFYFTAPGRIDFRVLVSDLAHTFKKIIRLQQIGARDEARYLGGVGRCGEALCCKKFLKGNLESVTLDMATDQNLAEMGANRVTGVCGKLMCCLKYELEYYREAKKKLPKIGSKIKTPKGEGIVIGQNVIKKSVTARLEEGDTILEVDC